MIRRLASFRERWQLLVLASVAVAAGLGLPVTFCAVNFDYLQLMCPIGFVEASVASRTVVVPMLPGVILVTLLTIVLGRSFCSWACPARYVGDATAGLLRRRLSGGAVGRAWRRTKRAVRRRVSLGAGDGLALLAGLVVGIAVFGFPAWSTFCPVGVLSRNVVELVTHARLRFDLAFLVLPLVVGLLFDFGWKCACPMGLVRGLAATKNRTLRPVVDPERCTRCGRCAQHCPAGLDPASGAIDGFSCSKCLNCLRDCRRDAIRLEIVER